MQIAGLRLVEDFISPAEEELLISYLDGNTWNGNGIEPNGELRRRTIQFGALFRYKTRKVESDLTPLPSQFEFLLKRMTDLNLYVSKPCNHLVVNEYQKGQGIMPHIDSEQLFGDTICSLSMLSDCVMEFLDPVSGQVFSYLLKRRSLLILQHDARYNYKHSISKNDIDVYDGKAVERGRRVSITFRTILD
jgi:alkylated DNA repair dioxygenase AlkB